MFDPIACAGSRLALERGGTDLAPLAAPDIEAPLSLRHGTAVTELVMQAWRQSWARPPSSSVVACRTQSRAT